MLFHGRQANRGHRSAVTDAQMEGGGRGWHSAGGQEKFVWNWPTARATLAMAVRRISLWPKPNYLNHPSAGPDKTTGTAVNL